MLNYDVSCFNQNLKSENIFWTIIKVWRNKFISNISHVLTRIFLWIFYVDLARDDNYWIASPSRGNIKNQFDCFKITMQVVRIFPYWTLKILFQFGSAMSTIITPTPISLENRVECPVGQISVIDNVADNQVKSHFETATFRCWCTCL